MIICSNINVHANISFENYFCANIQTLSISYNKKEATFIQVVSF